MTGSRHDLGLTHVALPIADAVRSTAFYERFADMQVVHERTDGQTGARVVWLSDLTRPFVIVLIETTVSHTLGGFAHLGRRLHQPGRGRRPRRRGPRRRP